MMPGLTKSYKECLRNRFSTDLTMRCQAEFEHAHHLAKGDFDQLKALTAEIKKDHGKNAILEIIAFAVASPVFAVGQCDK